MPPRQASSPMRAWPRSRDRPSVSVPSPAPAGRSHRVSPGRRSSRTAAPESRSRSTPASDSPRDGSSRRPSSRECSRRYTRDLGHAASLEQRRRVGNGDRVAVDPTSHRAEIRQFVLVDVQRRPGSVRGSRKRRGFPRCCRPSTYPRRLVPIANSQISSVAAGSYPRSRKSSYSIPVMVTHRIHRPD